MGPDSLLCTAFMIGSSGSDEQSSEPILLARKALEELVGKVDAVIPVEIGAGAVTEAMFLASAMGLPFLDADVVGGRSAPEVYLETITLFDIPRTPLVVANQNGEAKTLLKSSGYRETEKFLREFAAESGGCAYVIGYPMRLSTIRDVVGKGTVSISISLGEALKAGRLEDALRMTEGRRVFSGRVMQVEKSNEGGFLTGNATISDGKSELKVWFKNENLVSWLDGRPFITSPDLICILDKGCRGVYNRDLEEGAEVTVIGIPSLPVWRTNKGIELFGPESFGFGIKYKPLEEIIKEVGMYERS
jgi:DUF917 family protein